MRDTGTVTNKGRVLLIDDDVQLLRAYARVLKAAGFQVESVSDSGAVSAVLGAQDFDVVVSDLAMPRVTGIDILQDAHRRDPDLPVVLMTAAGDVATAAKAVEHGALRYLIKPIVPSVLGRIAEEAVRLRRVAQMNRLTLELLGDDAGHGHEAVDLTPRFERALASIQMAYQPIVCWSQQRVFAYEALLRTREASLARPENLVSAAERLGRLPDLGRAIRRSVARTLRAAPHVICFVNLHPSDLADDELLAASSPLAGVAYRVVLEVTECASLESIDLAGRLAPLRRLGFRIAIDDLGAGYSSLCSFTQLEPDAVKFDIGLVRDIDTEPTKRKVLESMVTLCRELGVRVIAEGVETRGERDALVEIGADLLQGYLFARPGPAFPSVAW